MALTEIPSELSSTPSIVDGGNATAITIDSSENVLVGKTDTSIGVAGSRFISNGQVQATASGQEVLLLNRLSSPGELLNFRKDGTTVGSIGTGSGLLTIGKGTGNLVFENALVAPCSDSSVGSSNGVVDLGASSRRFKDLYLSGGAYLGGTAAANKLDDYEEGTWTPTFSVTSGAVSIFSARYTKIGRQVIINLSFSITSAVSAGERFLIFTVPFTQFTAGTTDIGVVSVYPNGLNNNTGVVVNNSSGNTTQFAMVFTIDGVFASGSINCKLVYETNQ